MRSYLHDSSIKQSSNSSPTGNQPFSSGGLGKRSWRIVEQLSERKLLFFYSSSAANNKWTWDVPSPDWDPGSRLYLQKHITHIQPVTRALFVSLPVSFAMCWLLPPWPWVTFCFLRGFYRLPCSALDAAVVGSAHGKLVGVSGLLSVLCFLLFLYQVRELGLPFVFRCD